MPTPNIFHHKIPPPVIGVGVALAMVWLAKHTPVMAWPPWLRWGGAGLLFALGLTIELVAIYTFRRARTTINPLRPKASSQLVTQGIYQISRNPMYVGMGCQLLALVCYLAAPLSLLGLPLFMLLITELQIKPEERILGQNFGQDFADYCLRVRRWL